MIVVDNGKLKFSVCPTRGMGVLSVTMDDVFLGWNSPVKEDRASEADQFAKSRRSWMARGFQRMDGSLWSGKCWPSRCRPIHQQCR